MMRRGLQLLFRVATPETNRGLAKPDVSSALPAPALFADNILLSFNRYYAPRAPRDLTRRRRAARRKGGSGTRCGRNAWTIRAMRSASFLRLLIPFTCEADGLVELGPRFRFDFEGAWIPSTQQFPLPTTARGGNRSEDRASHISVSPAIYLRIHYCHSRCSGSLHLPRVYTPYRKGTRRFLPLARFLFFKEFTLSAD